ncbi:MAG: peptidoglycan DD-metalloendopeptidase family protein [Magnetococcales bacterium]|nr:peptidoglycan DD-metalloendopeptidase family protein [Magnetococcales bacterium]
MSGPLLLCLRTLHVRPLAIPLLALLLFGCNQEPFEKPPVRIASGPPMAWELEPEESRIYRSDSELYTVRPGDTLWAIAVVHELDPENLVQWNNIHDADMLVVGQTLRVAQPAPQPIYQDSQQADFLANQQPEQTTEQQILHSTQLPNQQAVNQQAENTLPNFVAYAPPVDQGRYYGTPPDPISEPAAPLEPLAEPENQYAYPTPSKSYPEQTNTVNGSFNGPPKAVANTAIKTAPVIAAQTTAPVLTPRPSANTGGTAFAGSGKHVQPPATKIVVKKKPVKRLKDSWILKSGPPKRWHWPVHGKVISKFGKHGNDRNTGIDIEVKQDEPIRAAASGIVSYADNELPGYGNLIIIRHGGSYTTAYAHNSKLQVSRGATVRAGEVIALAGKSGRVHTPRLHFELRRRIKPINPLKYLPKS